MRRLEHLEPVRPLLFAEDLQRRFAELSALMDGELPRAEHGSASAVGSPQSTDESALAETTDSAAAACQAESPCEEPIPDQLGRYRVLRLLGEGGFGRVFLGEDTQLGRQVALKVPKSDYLTSVPGVEVVLDEARAAAQLKHPGLAAVYDVQPADGRPYIVQEYIEGVNLQHWAKRRAHPSSAWSA